MCLTSCYYTSFKMKTEIIIYSPLDLVHHLPYTSPKGLQFPSLPPFLLPSSYNFGQRLPVSYPVAHTHSQSETTHCENIIIIIRSISTNFKLDPQQQTLWCIRLLHHKACCRGSRPDKFLVLSP